MPKECWSSPCVSMPDKRQTVYFHPLLVGLKALGSPIPKAQRLEVTVARIDPTLEKSVAGSGYDSATELMQRNVRHL